MIGIVRKYGGVFSGAFAHLIQRVTGVALLGYLLLHIHTVSMLSQGPAAFDAALAQFANPLFHLLEIALLGAVILHALNGIRLTLLDLGIGLGRQREMFWLGAIGVGGLLFLAGGVPIFLASVVRR